MRQNVLLKVLSLMLSIAMIWTVLVFQVHAEGSGAGGDSSNFRNMVSFEAEDSGYYLITGDGKAADLQMNDQLNITIPAGFVSGNYYMTVTSCGSRTAMTIKVNGSQTGVLARSSTNYGLDQMTIDSVIGAQANGTLALNAGDVISIADPNNNYGWVDRITLYAADIYYEAENYYTADANGQPVANLNPGNSISINLPDNMRTGQYYIMVSSCGNRNTYNVKVDGNVLTTISRSGTGFDMNQMNAAYSANTVSLYPGASLQIEAPNDGTYCWVDRIVLVPADYVVEAETIGTSPAEESRVANVAGNTSLSVTLPSDFASGTYSMAVVSCGNCSEFDITVGGSSNAVIMRTGLSTYDYDKLDTAVTSSALTLSPNDTVSVTLKDSGTWVDKIIFLREDVTDGLWNIKSYGKSISLIGDTADSNKGSIGLNYYEVIPAAVTVGGTASAVMTFWEGNVDLALATKTKSVSLDTNAVRDGAYRFSYSVPASGMTRTVYSKLTVVYANGNSYASSVSQYSIHDYAISLLNTGVTDPLKELLVTMLEYGSAAQTYFSENTGFLATTGVDSALLTDVGTITITAQDTTASDLVNPSISVYGSNLNLSSFVKLRVFFTIPEGANISNYYAKIDSNYYVPLQTNSIFVDINNKMIPYCSIDNIPVAELSKTHTVAVYFKDGTNYSQVSQTATISALGYAYRVVGNINANPNLQILMKRMANFNTKAVTYFG